MAATVAADSLWLAYGTRGVAKLIEGLSLDAERDAATRDCLEKLNGLASNQENKVSALSRESLVPTLKGLLGADAPETRRLAALLLASLAMLFPGRLAIRDAGAVATLSDLVAACSASDGGVAAASCSVLLALSESRDGCVALMQHDRLVATLVGGLEAPTVAGPCLNALANLLRQDLGVGQARA
jgi:hypothetical protein